VVAAGVAGALAGWRAVRGDAAAFIAEQRLVLGAIFALIAYASGRVIVIRDAGFAWTLIVAAGAGALAAPLFTIVERAGGVAASPRPLAQDGRLRAIARPIVFLCAVIQAMRYFARFH
jgi:hypothetical protein